MEKIKKFVKTIKKEYIIVLFVVLCVYCLQLGIEKYFNLHFLKMQLLYTPIISWIFMAFINISWIDKWERISILILFYFIPFEAIIFIILIFNPLLLFKFWIWILIILLSILYGSYILVKVKI